MRFFVIATVKRGRLARRERLGPVTEAVALARIYRESASIEPSLYWRRKSGSGAAHNAERTEARAERMVELAEKARGA